MHDLVKMADAAARLAQRIADTLRAAGYLVTADPEVQGPRIGFIVRRHAEEPEIVLLVSSPDDGLQIYNLQNRKPARLAQVSYDAEKDEWLGESVEGWALAAVKELRDA